MRTDCPVGSLDDLRKPGQDLAQVSVFSRLFNTTFPSTEDMPQWSTATEQERLDRELSWLAAVVAENHSRMLAVGLTRMAERYGVPSEADLTAHLSFDGRVDTALAGGLARALRHFWASDGEACVHAIVPKIEAAVRALLLELRRALSSELITRLLCAPTVAPWVLKSL